MIVHLDADAFYASVEQATDPRLRGRPVAVGGAKRGVVASASYEARRLGIFTTMPTARARKICPNLVVVSGDFEKYERFSRFMFSYLYDFTPFVEVASIDEGYFDLRGNQKKSPREIADILRRAIRQSLKLTISEGIGSNKLVSAVGSKLRKPASFIEVAAGEERAFLAPLENKWLPGVGPQMARTLNQAGLSSIGQIAAVTPQQLSLFAGNGARQMWEFAQGIDLRPVVMEPPAAKSWGEQETFEQDVTDEHFLLAKLRSMADRLFAKVRGERKAIRVVEVRIRTNDFEDSRRSESLDEPTDLETDAYASLARLFRKAWQRRVSLRLVGVTLSGVYPCIFQCGLPLVDSGVDPAQHRRLAPALDTLRSRYGKRAVMRGHDLFLQHYGEKARGEAKKVVKPCRSVRQEWAALNFKSGYSFLDSLLRPQDIVRIAAERGCRAVALTDPNLHGAVDFFIAAKAAGIQAIIAAEVVVAQEPAVAYVRDAEGYTNLCAVLSTPHRVLTDSLRQGLIVRPAGWLPEIRYADRSEKPLYGVLQSIRTLTLLNERHAGKRVGDFHFPAEQDFVASEEALRDSVKIAEQCTFEFELGGLRFPHYKPSDGSSAHDFLRRITQEGLLRRYAHKPTSLARAQAQIAEELTIIAEVGYEEYFLLVWDLLQDCRERGIEWITRGSAADSLVCYCLGISDVCPLRFELYFQRFLNRERMALHKLPDVDMDFAHDRKDDVVDLIFEKYGSHAAVVGGFQTFQGRSAFADIAKVMGVSEYQIRRMTEFLPQTSARGLPEKVEASQECRGLDFTEDPYATALRLAEKLDGFPRHAKMHPCGVVLSRVPITHLTPVFESAKGYPTTHLDMEQVEAIGLVKMDILAQGGLAVMRDTKQLLAAKGISVNLKSLEPWADAVVWKMIARGQARGVHHIESPAMTTLERMVNVRTIDDLIAIVSVIRPGAANSMKKEQFANRAQGLEPTTYLHPSLEPILRTTYGIVAYEEHILQICEAFAGLPSGRADVLRRALSKSRMDTIKAIQAEFVAAAVARGRTAEEIERVWELVSGFQGYAFCRAHSTAYGIEAYEAAWLKHYHPAEFLACVLEHGKGFYSKLVYSIECRRLGIGFLPPAVASPHVAFQPEQGAIRVPLHQIKGLSHGLLERWENGHPFVSLRDFTMRTKPSSDEMNALLRVGALDCFGASRAEQFWEYRQLAQWPCDGEQLLLGAEKAILPSCELAEPSFHDHLEAEMELLGFPVSGHPLDLYDHVAWETYCEISGLSAFHGERVTIAGLIIEDRLHHQADGRPMKFVSLCDRTGTLECELFASAYRRFGSETIRYPVVEITGRVMPLTNGNGQTLQVETVKKARRRWS